MSGRHSSDSSAGFYKDLGMMILGIILVGAAVFLVLYLLAGDEAGTGTTTEPAALETSTTALATTDPGPTTTVGADSTSTSAAGSTSSPDSTDVPVRPPSEVTVVVLNSIGIQGVAGRLTVDLVEAGYQTLEPSNYEPEQDPSRIWYRGDFSPEANELLEFVPDARVEPIPDEELESGADIVIVLGTGYEE